MMNRSGTFASLVCVICAIPLQAPGATIHVAPTGNDSGSGATWQEAKLTVAAGLAAAQPGDQVWVATGVYVERIALKAGVALYGGFDQTEATPADRAPFPRQTTDTSASVLDGSRGTVVTSPQGATSATRIDGFTIRNGGYGISCVSSSPTIRNNTLLDYSSSGISCATSSSPQISGNIISGGRSRGIYCSSSSAPAITGNLITDVDGTGIYCFSSSPNIAGNVVTKCTVGGISATSSSPHIVRNRLIANCATRGGGIYVTGGAGPLVIANNVIVGNSATGSDGGGIYWSGSGAAGVIANNTITHNAAFAGTGPVHGGIYCSSGSLTISNNIVAWNASGIYSADGSPVLRNNCVYNPSGYNYSGLNAGTGDISVDPLMVSPEYAQVHLTAGSPCINAGYDTPAQPSPVDIDGQPRTQGGRIDIGADEFDGNAPSFAPPVVRVSPSGNDAHDGSNWELAKRTIQAGIDAARLGGGEVWVAAGTYHGKVTMAAMVYVYGGFDGTETQRAQRAATARRTSIHGVGSFNTEGLVEAEFAGYRTGAVDGFTITDADSFGIYCRESAPIISNNTIAASGRAGIFGDSAAPLIVGNTINANQGGGVELSSSRGGIAGNRIIANRGSYGGGIACSNSSPLVTGNIIAANSGGGLYLSSSSANVVNNTVAQNRGRGVYCGGSSSPVLSNNVIAFNSSGIANTGASPSLSNNCVYNPDGQNYSGLTAGPGDLTVDPQFLAIEYGRFFLKAGSPCIDAGSDAAVVPGSVDYEGQPRVQGARVDIGADEFDGATPAYVPRIVRVRPSGDDANDGSTWELAKRSVQAAIDAAGLDGGEVWVSAGTYREQLQLRPWAPVYGGFSGAEQDREQRSRSPGLAVLDGDKKGSVVTASGLGWYTTTIEGFTLTNGRSPWAGGLFCHESSIQISGNAIVDNGGHGIYFSSASGSRALNSVIQGNTGNGIACTGDAPFIIAGCTISRNAYSGVSGPSFMVLSNNIIAFNATGILAFGGIPELKSNCVYNPDGTNYSGLAPGASDLQLDPRLVAERYGRVHLRADSPCIDAGDDASADSAGADMDGEVRVQGTRVDIGADEFNGTAPSHTPAVVRVALDGNDANDGSTWALAKQTVQAAVDAAAVGGGDVWVAAGVYNERITLPTWVYAYGGFAGTEESPGQRDWRAHASVLDGGGAGTVVRAVAGGFRTTTIDGFTIRNGSDGGIYCDYSCPVIAHNTITGNSRANGGGIYCTVTGPVIVGNIITGNSATGPAPQSGLGGGVYCGSAQVFGNLIVGNTAASIGGGVYSPLGTVSIANNTVAGNTAADKGGAIGWGANVTGSVANNVLAFNSSGVYGSATATPPALSHNCLYNPDGEDYSGVTPGTGDVALAPLFVNRQAGDYRLASDSPCIDAGNNALAPTWLTSDLGLQARFIDDPESEDCRHTPGTCGIAPIIDMGAYEYNPATTADLNHDGHIGAADFESFLAAFGRSRGHALYNAYADYDADGIVALADYQHWLQQYRLAVGDPLAAAPLEVLGDFDRNGRVDVVDLQHLVNCAGGAGVPQVGVGCTDADLDHDSDVDQDDFGVFQRCYSGERQVSLTCRQ